MTEFNQQMDTMTTGEQAANSLRGVAIAADPNAPRQFLCPHFPTGKFLVQAGRPRVNSLVNTNSGIENLAERQGDIWVKFTAGVFALFSYDPDHDLKLEWLEAHMGDRDLHKVYHESRGNDPRQCSVDVGLCQESTEHIGDWVEMKAGQIPTANRDISTNPNMDVDGYFLRGKAGATKHVKSAMAGQVEANENAAKTRASRE